MEAEFNQNGIVVVRNLFSQNECYGYRQHYIPLRLDKSYPGDETGDAKSQFPRMINMHKWDKISETFLFDPRITNIIKTLIGNFFALQTMIYFKPPNAKGQAWHQDEYYFKATSIAAWLALDDATIENGCLDIIPGRFDVLPTIPADTTESFTDISLDVNTTHSYPLLMKKGDVAFFDGRVIHGSKKNRSDKFRCSLIAHYAPNSIKQIAKGYSPVLSEDRQAIHLEYNDENFIG